MRRYGKEMKDFTWIKLVYTTIFTAFSSLTLCLVLLTFIETVDQYLLDKTLPATQEDRLWTPFRRTHSAQSYRSYVYKSAHRCRYSRTRHKLLGTHK